MEETTTNKKEKIFGLQVPRGVARDCMFCGSHKLLVEQMSPDRDYLVFRVRCVDCASSGPVMQGDDWGNGILEAISKWNVGFPPISKDDTAL